MNCLQKNQWLIRKWKDGDIDFVLYKKYINASKFEVYKFYRINKKQTPVKTFDSTQSLSDKITGDLIIGP